MIYVFFALSLAASFLFWLNRRDNRKLAQEEVKFKAVDNMLKDVQRVKIVRDSLASNVANSKRVRDKYTRK